MLKREFKNNLKSLLIWTSIPLLLFLMVFLIYPTIIDKLDPALMNSYVDAFPEGMMKAFNFDIVDIMSAFGWFKSEGFMMILLIGGMYAATLGGNILLKEENDGTINYLLSKPISRRKILSNKIIVGLGNITLMMLTITLFNYIGLTITGDFDVTVFFLLNLMALLTLSVIFGISLFISTFFRKNKVMTTLAIGFVFISYILQTISSLTESFEWIKYFSVFELASVRDIALNRSVDLIYIVVGLGLLVLSLLLTHKRYNQKEFY